MSLPESSKPLPGVPNLANQEELKLEQESSHNSQLQPFKQSSVQNEESLGLIEMHHSGSLTDVRRLSNRGIAEQPQACLIFSKPKINNQGNPLIERVASGLRGDQIEINSDDSVRQKRNYNFVPIEKRERLISYLSRGTSTIKEAASKFKINYSTAKYIFKKHRSRLLQDEEIKNPSKIPTQLKSNSLDIPVRFSSLIIKAQKIAVKAAQLTHATSLDRDDLLDLIMDTRNTLDFMLLQVGRVPADQQSQFIDFILSFQRKLDLYFMSLGMRESEGPRQVLNDYSVLQEQLKVQGRKVMSRLQVIVHGVVQNSVLRELSSSSS